MSPGNTLTTVESELPWGDSSRRTTATPFSLVIAWSLEEPSRNGERTLITGPSLIGRGEPEADDPAPRTVFGRHRPHQVQSGPPLGGARISRKQLLVEPDGDGLLVRSVGRCRLFVNGRETTEARVVDGDTLLLRNALLLIAVRRPELGKTRAFSVPPFDFGTPDPYGMVGESQAIWALREELAVTARAGMHVLIHGPSGAGKELAARAIHGMSSRAHRPLVARNAATFTESLIDAELFGNIRNFPNVGTPERPGLIGEADRSSLFLDEIGELPSHMQAHLLRVIDRDGEYTRLGESKPRKADIRLIAATNRPVESLKHDFAARLTTRVALPGLNSRPEDIPLIAQTILARFADQSPDLEARFFERRHGRRAEIRVAPELIEALLRHEYRLNVRELDRLLWVAIASSPGAFVSLTPEVERELAAAAEVPVSSRPTAVQARPNRGAPPGREAIVAALAEADGRVAVAAQALGLSSRFVLYRLMRQHGIAEAESAHA
jgi:two-component system nitrogen regulation response regulator GlnG/two-component system response regulator HydG